MTHCLPLPGEEEPGDGMSGARPIKPKKGNAKAKAEAKKRTQKTLKTLGDVGDNGAEPEETEKDDQKKRRKIDKDAKARLDALKLQTDMVHMQQKWTCRIKTINIEVTTSIKASEEFDFLEG